MAQLDLFQPLGASSTAIYPNRQRDRLRVETALGLTEQGHADTEFLTSKGTLFARGYRRIVYGEHGYCQLAPNGLH